jgi:hypothetical protein
MYTSAQHSRDNAIFLIFFKTKANFGPSAKYLPVRKFNLAHGLVDNKSLKTLMTLDLYYVRVYPAYKLITRFLFPSA